MSNEERKFVVAVKPEGVDLAMFFLIGVSAFDAMMKACDKLKLFDGYIDASEAEGSGEPVRPKNLSELKDTLIELEADLEIKEVFEDSWS